MDIQFTFGQHREVVSCHLLTEVPAFPAVYTDVAGRSHLTARYCMCELQVKLVRMPQECSFLGVMPITKLIASMCLSALQPLKKSERLLLNISNRGGCDLKSSSKTI